MEATMTCRGALSPAYGFSPPGNRQCKSQEAVQELKFLSGCGQVRKPLAACSQHHLVRPACSISVPGDNQEQGKVSRRDWLILSTSLAGVLAASRHGYGVPKFSDLAESNAAIHGSSVINSNGEFSWSPKTWAPKAGQEAAEDVRSWYLGKDFAIRVPPGYEDEDFVIKVPPIYEDISAPDDEIDNILRVRPGQTNAIQAVTRHLEGKGEGGEGEEGEASLHWKQ